MRRPFRKYLRTFILIAAIGLLGVGAFNVIVDPHKTFALLNTPRLDAHKTARGGRIAKAEQLTRTDWDTVVLGNSRVDAGIDPANPAWQSRRVFNCGLSGLNFIEEAKVFEFLETVTKPKTIILCIDFFHFQDGEPIADEFNYSRFNLKRSLTTHYLDALWGATSTWHSVLSLGNYRKHRAPEYSDLGLRIKPMAPAHQSGREAFDRYVPHAVQTWRLQGTWSGDTRSLSRFADVLRMANDHQTKLIVVILPVHALDLEMVRCQMGGTTAIENWKRGLVAAIAACQRDQRQPPIPLWDFTGYRGYTADPVPPKDDPHPMTWYWEPSHFRKELGDLLIARILNQPAPAASDLTSFGELVNESNIEAHLARQRAGREDFARQFAGEIKTIEDRVRASRK
jgi:hypothetical protein